VFAGNNLLVVARRHPRDTISEKPKHDAASQQEHNPRSTVAGRRRRMIVRFRRRVFGGFVLSFGFGRLPMPKIRRFTSSTF
jgi:hypothetical protein